MTDYYTILGVPFNATPDEIRNAYFHLARTMHPDVNSDPKARESFLKLQKAYDTLSQSKRRAEYDANIPADKRQIPSISVSARSSQSVLGCISESQLVYVLIDLVCTADIVQEKPPPSHVCLVLDRSTSMQGQRMDMVKSSSLNLLQQLHAQDYLSVVAFSDRAEVLIPPARAASLSKSDHRVSLLQTGGATEILRGLALGVEQLRKTDNSILRHLILLTDGHTYGDEEGCIQLAKEAADDNIMISVLGIGNEWNDALMDQIASLSGGNTLYVTTARDLDNFMMQKLADLEAVYARSLRFEFKSAEEVKLRYAFRLEPNVSPLEIDSPILLGDIHYRKSVTFLLEFLVPPIADELDHFSLASGKIWMDIPGLAVTQNRVILDLHCATRKNVEPETPPAMIVEAMSKLTLYRLQEKVRLEVAQGEVEKATRHMHYLATHLLSQGDRELAHTVLIEAEHVQQSRNFSGEGEKRIKYGTRALLLPSVSGLKT